jgi:hypothetical protein
MDNIFEASLSQKESTLITAAIIRNAVEKIREKETPCIYRGKESVKAYNDGLEFAANFLSNIANEMVCSSSYSSMRPLTPTRDDLNALWCSYGVADEYGHHEGDIFEYAHAVLFLWGKSSVQRNPFEDKIYKDSDLLKCYYNYSTSEKESTASEVLQESVDLSIDNQIDKSSR